MMLSLWSEPVNRAVNRSLRQAPQFYFVGTFIYIIGTFEECLWPVHLVKTFVNSGMNQMVSSVNNCWQVGKKRGP
jgi:hypothetical protein